MAASHRRAVARCAGKVREMELNLPALPALERLRCVGEYGRRAAETRPRAGITTSTALRFAPMSRQRKGGFINELLAARGAGSPVKFIVSVMPEAARSLSTSRLAKRQTAKATTR